MTRNHPNPASVGCFRPSPSSAVQPALLCVANPVIVSCFGHVFCPLRFPKGRFPKGEVPKGEVPQGEVPKGEVPKGEVPKGEVPKGEVPKGGPCTATKKKRDECDIFNAFT